MIRAAIIGLGRWGQTLVGSVQGKSDGIRFTHAVSRDPARVRDFAGQHGLTVFSSLDAALADPAIDAIVLATPHSQHVDRSGRGGSRRKGGVLRKTAGAQPSRRRARRRRLPRRRSRARHRHRQTVLSGIGPGGAPRRPRRIRDRCCMSRRISATMSRPGSPRGATRATRRPPAG